MSDMSPSIVLFEHPLNEKIRIWLRIEFLLQQLDSRHSLTDIANTLTFFRSMTDLLDVLERGDIRTELLKELERQQQKIVSWSNVPGVDHERVENVSNDLKLCATTLMNAPRLGLALKEDRLISLVRQRLNIPGGCCSFDLPTLHLWLHTTQEQRDRDVEQWMTHLQPLKQALTLILSMIRQSGEFRSQISLNGFFQDNAENADLLRMKITLAEQIYPQVSGHKSRYAIRFLPLDSEKGIVPERLSFELACC